MIRGTQKILAKQLDRAATYSRAVYHCYEFNNPATGGKIYYKQTSTCTIVLNLGRKELFVKPKDWLLDIPNHREKRINIGVFNEKYKEFLKLLE